MSMSVPTGILTYYDLSSSKFYSNVFYVFTPTNILSLRLHYKGSLIVDISVFV